MINTGQWKAKTFCKVQNACLNEHGFDVLQCYC